MLNAITSAVARLERTGNMTAIDITLVPSLDSDGDGMPDVWETLNGLVNGFNDAGDDKDGDGLTNLMEFRMGSMANAVDKRCDLAC